MCISFWPLLYSYLKVLSSVKIPRDASDKILFKMVPSGCKCQLLSKQPNAKKYFHILYQLRITWTVYINNLTFLNANQASNRNYYCNKTLLFVFIIMLYMSSVNMKLFSILPSFSFSMLIIHFNQLSSNYMIKSLFHKNNLLPELQWIILYIKIIPWRQTR